MGIKEKGAWRRGTQGKENMVIIRLWVICLKCFRVVGPAKCQFKTI